ncbi:MULTISPECIES: sarcosine oxidase subunit alpha family protein [unclassified Sphingomonas]|uniref:sarcosine oxidase subunit alpha family protein n=1 Tax=unclassified Sphingomonas TaxID=196159 RepID=UPI0006FCB347|nr:MULTISPECIES: sarcosine oxidase subunit alpha family protein [unclassified Sphingomonas]KQX25990.1 sarcosine oxidase subunit alpha [Sphingomonas sp. Root1294]KQY69056.1 sarcosine oxidase subunit alpha [Sphingomonas sp. Root50]KRB89310.1 sarcosine oxidase subunit alpha [Sphingomonas sp. Root720]
MTDRLATGNAAIDRSRPIRFSFDGKAMTGFAGDTLASALLANGVRLVGRSFKYHRPRGIFSAGAEEPNALVELGHGARREPNSKATTVELVDGLEAWSQNRFPSLRLDLLSVNSLLSPFLKAGFYYKTFMWPAAFWEKLYEPAIRRAAGLGRAAGQPDPDHYDKGNAFCDLLVIGGGPAGMAAALAAADAGQRVLLCESDFLLGASLRGRDGAIDGGDAADWLGTAARRIADHPNITLMLRTTMFAVYDHSVFAAVEQSAPGDADAPRQRVWRIVTERSILATGAIERPMLFDGNDLPGVMLAGAVATYATRFGVQAGQRIAFAVDNDAGWESAADAARAGAHIVAIIDRRPGLSARAEEIAPQLNIVIHLGATVRRGHGGRSLKAVTIAGADGKATRLAIDCLAVSGGWNPNIGIATHLGARPRWNEATGQFLADARPEGMILCGAAAGQSSANACVRHGAAAGRSVVDRTSFDETPAPVPASDRPSSVRSLGGGKVFVDLQHDVTEEDVRLAFAEGYRSVEHLKRYTTLGMATDQGRTANFLGLSLMAELTGQSIAATGTTTARPPAVPIAIGALAGTHRGGHFRPLRKTVTHDWALERGAPMIEAGLWRRAQWYPREGETDWLTSVNREVLAVRSAVGICDVSTLGKIDIQGPDAGALLDFVYANLFSTLAVGRVRYGAMLREDGFVFDDGTTARLGDQHFLMSTTTANAEAVMEHLEWCLQVLKPAWRVQIASVTEQWAQFSIAGPNARPLVAALLEPDIAIDDASLPHMSVMPVRLRSGVAGRLFRMSFSGERGFEIAVPARHGLETWRALVELGRPLGVEPYGTEALGVLRIEKGHVAGPELNGQTTAADIGLGRMVSKKKDFIGRLMALREPLADPMRPRLVGLRSSRPFSAGAHLLPAAGPFTAAHDQGHITSAAYSPTLRQWIGLGLLDNGSNRIGETIAAHDPVRNAHGDVEVCSPVFVDPEGTRVHG